MRRLITALLVALVVPDGVAKKRGTSGGKKGKESPLVSLTPQNFQQHASQRAPAVVAVLDANSRSADSLTSKMRRLSRIYQKRLGFFVVKHGDLPELGAVFPMGGGDAGGALPPSLPTVKIITGGLRVKHGQEHTFSGTSELSYENLKKWIDKYLAGKLVKARPSLEELENCHTLEFNDKERALQLNDLAVRYQAVGNMGLAIQQLEAALALDPSSPVLHYNMGQAREMMGEMEGAIAEYKLALDNDIRYMDAYHSLARAISVLGDAESAVNILQLATKMQPYDGSMYNSLGVALRANNSYTRALESFTLALSLNHTLDESLLNIGSTWMDLGNFDRAAGFFMRALEANERSFAALTNLVYCNQKMYHWQDYNHFIALLDQAHEVFDQMVHPFHAAAYPVSGERFKDLALSYASNTLSLVHQKFRLSHREANETSASPRIRVGYISTDLRHNPARDLLLHTMKLHSTADFETYFLALDRDNEFVDDFVDQYVDLSVTPYRKVAVVIKELAIDILVNTMVPTDPWFRVAGLNPSFCQVSLAGGYPATTGTKLVNYVISDRMVSPPELHHLYVERVAYTPFALQPLVDESLSTFGGDSSPPLTRTLLGIDEQAFVLCYFEVPQQKAVYPSGLLPKTFDLWCSILARSPGAVLLIIGVKPGGATAQHIHQEAAVRGLLPSRFVLVDDTYQGHAWEHTAASRASGALVDLFLDNPGVGTPLHGSTFPRLGVPMLTLPSESPFTRTGASMSVLQGRAMAGVASSAKDFEDSASYYASKGGRPKLGQERDKLLGLMKQSSSRSHNVKLWVSDLETAYRRLHRRMVRKRMHG